MTWAPEGTPQMLGTTAILGGAVAAISVWVGPAAGVLYWLAVVPLIGVWIWSIAFFRDPRRVTTASPNELCSPADGTVADITKMDHYEGFEGPVVRVGIFLSLFNVHINRASCAGTVTRTRHKPGKFFAAMKTEAIDQNESNTLWIDPDKPIPGPVVIRQIVGMAARRIVCHAVEGTRLTAGERFGLIKFGSRTELILPDVEGVDILVNIGDKVQAGVTLMIRCPATAGGTADDAHNRKDDRSLSGAST